MIMKHASKFACAGLAAFFLMQGQAYATTNPDDLIAKTVSVKVAEKTDAAPLIRVAQRRWRGYRSYRARRFLRYAVPLATIPLYYRSRRRHYYYDTYSDDGYGGRCSYWSRRCVKNWGYRNSNYYGCMKYHRCR